MYSGNVVPGASVTSVDLGTDAYRMNVEVVFISIFIFYDIVCRPDLIKQ